MKKKEYIQTAVDVILNRICFHAPVVYDDDIDKTMLFVHGVDISKPIFKFDKILNKNLFKAFKIASKEKEFNLLISSDSLGKVKEKELKTLKNVVLYNKNTSSLSFVEAINKLNINYPSSSNYNLVFKDKFFKINNQMLNPHYEEFALRQVCVVDNFFVDYSEFVLNGSNFFVKFQNKSEDSKRIELELNIPLKKGYYFFKRMTRCVMIENLVTGEKMFLNHICRNAKFSFSEVDGLENSVYCCVNVKVSLLMKGGEEGFVFFNFGEEKLMPKGLREVENLKGLSRKKSCEIFNLQVKTKNVQFDQFFNKTLPQRIWVNWLNGEVDSALEEKYLTYKRLFIKGTNELSFVNFKEIGLKELGIFNGEYYKKIIIVSGNEKFLRVGRTFFYNINGVTEHSLKSNETISLCFGE